MKLDIQAGKDGFGIPNERFWIRDGFDPKKSIWDSKITYVDIFQDTLMEIFWKTRKYRILGRISRKSNGRKVLFLLTWIRTRFWISIRNEPSAVNTLWACIADGCVNSQSPRIDQVQSCRSRKRIINIYFQISVPHSQSFHRRTGTMRQDMVNLFVSGSRQTSSSYMFLLSLSPVSSSSQAKKNRNRRTTTATTTTTNKRTKME